jgi:hypothetical protein
MLDYLDRQELRISEPVAMVINDRLSPGITVAFVSSSNDRSTLLFFKPRCSDSLCFVVTETLRRLQGRKPRQCRLYQYIPTDWWFGKAKGDDVQQTEEARQISSVFAAAIIRTDSGYIVKGPLVT